MRSIFVKDPFCNGEVSSMYSKLGRWSAPPSLHGDSESNCCGLESPSLQDTESLSGKDFTIFTTQSPFSWYSDNNSVYLGRVDSGE